MLGSREAVTCVRKQLHYLLRVVVKVVFPRIFADRKAFPHLVLRLRFAHVLDEVTDRLLHLTIIRRLERVVYALREVKAQLRQMSSTQLAHGDALTKAKVNGLIGDTVKVDLEPLLVDLMQQLAGIGVERDNSRH